MTENTILNVAKAAALAAGDLVRQGLDSSFTVEEKEGRKNLVTSYDTKSEELIISTIQKHFPNHTFLSEECGQKGENRDEIMWIIDPIDGTVNFAYHIPLFTISIAAVYRGEIIAGVVYAPMLGEMFSAEKRKGAFLNERPIKASPQTDLMQSLLATGLPYNTHENPRRCIERLTTVCKKGIPLRRMGSAALDLAYVACGRFDGFWEVSLHPWDYAAGKLLIEEAGGALTTIDGAPLAKYRESSVLASNTHIHDQLKTLLGKDHD